MQSIKHHPSPNYSSRRGHEIDCVVIHATGQPSPSPTVALMCAQDSKVSCHFLIPRNPEEGVLQLVPLEYKAWHAGRAEMAKKGDVNLFSVAIQLVGNSRQGFTDWQYEATAMLCAHLMDTCPKIDFNRIVGHDMISERPNGPGPLWSWQRFFDLMVRKMYNIPIERE